ncbi:MAG: tRNA preQ1(34) S-adenosylmethionine ribosyltransferase-isomerase QueA [Planctomycetota bacterium]
MIGIEGYDFPLPEGSVARHPRRDRSVTRLLRLPHHGQPTHHRADDLPELVPPKTLFVLNDTRVVKARLRGRRDSGGAVEALVLSPVGSSLWRVLLGGSVKEGEDFDLAGSRVKLQQRESDGFAILDFGASDPREIMASKGELPIPPYFGRGPLPEDEDDYQTSYARREGAVAAPTAGLHFHEGLRRRLEGAGHSLVSLTLHVGPGTFLPVRAADPLAHRVLGESASVSPETLDAIQQARGRGRRVAAVGTTSCRVLEALARRPGARSLDGDIALTITSPFRFRWTDLLLTNFHLPRSSLLLLAAAFSGRQRLLKAYGEAAGMGYLFYSYGDLTLLE